MSKKAVVWIIIIALIVIILMNRNMVLSWFQRAGTPMRIIQAQQEKPVYQHVVSQLAVKNIMDVEPLIPVSDFQMVSFATNIRDNSRDIMAVLANRQEDHVYFSQQYGKIIGDAQAVIASAKAIKDINDSPNILATMDSIISRTEQIIDLSKR